MWVFQLGKHFHVMTSSWIWHSTHWGRGEMNDILQTTLSNVFFLNENVWISIKISLKFVHKGPIHNIPALVQIMDWCRPGDKPLSEPMMLVFRRKYASLGLNGLILPKKHFSYSCQIPENILKCVFFNHIFYISIPIFKEICFLRSIWI